MVRELRQALRTLLRNPGFTATAVLILALGSGATTAIFSVAYGVMLRDLPYNEPERLVALWANLSKLGLSKANVGVADYFDWRQRQQVFEDMALTRSVGNFNLTEMGEPERLNGARTTASLFTTLRATPLIGRTFTEEEQLDPARASSVAVLSYGLWQRRFGGDPSIVGRKIQLNGQPHEVIGVMRPEFRYPSSEFELWTPLYVPPEALRVRFDHSYRAVARLKPGVTLAQAAAHMDVIGANLAREYPKSNQDTGVIVAPMLSDIGSSVSTALWVLLAAVGTLFLIGCANLANLLLVRATGRSKEFAVRMALGATRGRLTRQFLIETIPIAAAGAALGVLVAGWLLAILLPALPATMPRVEEIGLHGPVLLFSTLLSAAAALLVAIAPAAQVSANVERGPARRGHLRDGLLIAQIACTVVLLVGAGLLIRSFVHLRGTNPGFEPNRVLSLHLAVTRAKHGPDDAGVARYLGRLIDRVRAVPGVEAVGIVNRLPLGGQTQTLSVRFEGKDVGVDIDSRSVNGGYFRSLGIPLIAGRTFTENDSAERPAVGIIDERTAREVFGSESPIGKRFRIGVDIAGMDFPWIEVVGVVGHLRHEGLDRDPRPQVYWPYAQRTQDRMAMAVKTAGDPASMTSAVRAAIREVDPDQPLYDVRPMAEVVDRTLGGNRLNMLLVGTFAALALLLASIGLYGVVSQLTARRWREFGIRMALGADRRDVGSLVLKQGLGRAITGLAIGLVLSAALTRLLATLLHGVRPLDIVTYISVAALLVIVVLAASYLPARRAMKLDPAEALRVE